MTVTSAAFEDGGTMPARYTCDADEASPPLEWERAKGSGGYALTMIDPDAPGHTFVHWLVWNIPPSTTSLNEGALSAGAVQGTNSLGNASYAGPCPPQGDVPHHYELTVYAVEPGATNDLEPGDSLDALIKVLRCCTAAEGTIIASYQRP
jgi:Raf kinase inhibitor-like YbhB/YbcL family protein